MPESNPVAQPSLGQFVRRQSPEEEFALFSEVAEALINDPVKLRAVAVNAGISTPNGALTHAYGGK